VGARHEVTRAGVRQALAIPEIDVCAEASSAAAAIDAALDSGADCCLLEVALPGGGIAAAAEIKSRRPDTTVVMLADSPTAAELMAALRAGASGYLPVGMDPQRLAAAIQDAHRGSAAIPRHMVTELVDAIRDRTEATGLDIPRRLRQRLTRREAEVLALLGEDLPTTAIAAELGVSPVTVRRHISEVMRKAGVQDRKELLSLLQHRSTA